MTGQDENGMDRPWGNEEHLRYATGHVTAQRHVYEGKAPPFLNPFRPGTQEWRGYEDCAEALSER